MLVSKPNPNDAIFQHPPHVGPTTLEEWAMLPGVPIEIGLLVSPAQRYGIWTYGANSGWERLGSRHYRDAFLNNWANRIDAPDWDAIRVFHERCGRMYVRDEDGRKRLAWYSIPDMHREIKRA